MKRFFYFLIYLVVLITVIPIASVLLSKGIYKPDGSRDMIDVYVTAEDRTVKMNKEQYLKEVVSAEMPAEFESEALKAQAVAARTYLEYHIEKYAEEGIPEEHKGAVTCTDYRHCKAWMSEEERKAAWDTDKAEEYWEKISRAVEETKGQLMTYEDKPISAVFHSTSSGRTETAMDVWGGDLPYLQSVDSPGEEMSPKFLSEKSIAVEEYKKIMEEKYNDVNWELGLYDSIQRSDAGGIKTISIGGRVIPGTEFRTLLDLRSTNAELVTEGENIIIKVKGNGHGVGMSQYGANYMAQQGKTYEEILKHYYTGATLKLS